MLRFQASLPRLPVPTLSSTASKYLETVRPHLTPSEFLSTKSTVKEFVESGQAAELQKRLEARAGDPNVKNWLADWWNEAAYMGYRDPVVVYVSYFYVHMQDLRRQTGPKRAASLIKAMLPFREMVET
jgi:carnitine O-acetyltransferase